MRGLIIMTIALSNGMAIWLYIFTRAKAFCVLVALFGSSAAIPVFLHSRCGFGYAWLIWIIAVAAVIFYLGKKYPDKMKEWEKQFWPRR